MSELCSCGDRAMSSGRRCSPVRCSPPVEYHPVLRPPPGAPGGWLWISGGVCARPEEVGNRWDRCAATQPQHPLRRSPFLREGPGREFYRDDATGTGARRPSGSVSEVTLVSGKHHKAGWWRRAGRGRQESGPRRYLTEMVDRTGSAHLLLREAFEQGLRDGTGRYLTVCGRRIESGSLSARPQRCCRPCAVLQPSGMSAPQPQRGTGGAR
jgi:hypothetical protein